MKHESKLRLRNPTDFEILDLMSDGERYTPGYVAECLDRDSGYMRNRIRELAGNGLIDRVGNSTMYILTQRGRVALELRDQYEHEEAREFGMLVDEELARRESECAGEEDRDADVGV